VITVMRTGIRFGQRDGPENRPSRYCSVMKVLFLDHDGVICLLSEYGSHFKRAKKVNQDNHIKPIGDTSDLPIELRYDDFNEEAIKTLNNIMI